MQSIVHRQVALYYETVLTQADVYENGIHNSSRDGITFAEDILSTAYMWLYISEF